VEQYFNYMGCLAVEGTYDRMFSLLDGALGAAPRLARADAPGSGRPGH
jgi:hypothetical protein